jgi:hypothetical protein
MSSIRFESSSFVVLYRKAVPLFCIPQTFFNTPNFTDRKYYLSRFWRLFLRKWNFDANWQCEQCSELSTFVKKLRGGIHFCTFLNIFIVLFKVHFSQSGKSLDHFYSFSETFPFTLLIGWSTNRRWRFRRGLEGFHFERTLSSGPQCINWRHAFWTNAQFKCTYVTYTLNVTYNSHKNKN